ncbi:hypothetical protein GFY24_33925 [Nocardia sp. SYP-A9097]|uniref:hypothetical protein n=1 Tax=Nocardia sp. SYP-A9097 TaxID=2663237 RepID=UPI00129A4198|nr:hypothetical protein [Nocardia sp. SYP-A9097]MRH92366.1 hypothetical protein [Nocardia sp. SYP-A9097]
MLISTGSFSRRFAPCGAVREGACHVEKDSEGITIEYVTFACGCTHTHYSDHGGGVRCRTVYHDGNTSMNRRCHTGAE